VSLRALLPIGKLDRHGADALGNDHIAPAHDGREIGQLDGTRATHVAALGKHVEARRGIDLLAGIVALAAHVGEGGGDAHGVAVDHPAAGAGPLPGRVLLLLGLHLHGDVGGRLLLGRAEHADPLAASIARRRIDQTTLAGSGPTATNEYLGLMLILDDLFPDLVGRALKLSGGQTAIDALKGAIEAVNEQKGWVIDVPAHYGNEIWIPIAGKCDWTGAAPVQTLGAWTKVRLTSRRISARRLS